MSAICGVIALDEREPGGRELVPVRARLAPLGPDGGGVWTGRSGRLGVAVAAALRHATPADAADRQPAVDAGTSSIVVADARIYDRRSLAARLGLGDASALPDSSLVLAAYERWGERALEQLVGDFAIAIVDRRRGGVLLARDHLGARPLVVHRSRDSVAFASNAWALAALDGIGHEIDRAAVAETLALSFTSRRTLVRGVEWVPPGGAIWIDEHGTRSFSWWHADPLAIEELPAAEHARRLRDVFTQATADRMGGARRPGATTSGGLDSASVTATAARELAPNELRSYTAAPLPGWSAPGRPGWDADESPLVRELAALHSNIAGTFIHVDPHEWTLFERHEALWRLGGGPVRNPCNSIWIDALWQRAARDGVDVLLTGALGNVEFSADGQHWLVELVRLGRLREAGREARIWSAKNGEPLARVLARGIAYELLPPRAQLAARRAIGREDAPVTWLRRAALHPAAAADLNLAEHVPLTDELDPEDPRVLAILALQMASTQADVQAARSALTGVEPRDPTGDRRVVELAMRQPEWVRRRRGTTRWVVREAMSDRLPPSIARRTRRGEQLPDWLDVITARRRDIETELEAAREHEPSRTLIDLERLTRLVGDWPARDARAQPAIVRDYRLALLRALNVSRYLRWFESAGAEKPAQPAPTAVA